MVGRLYLSEFVPATEEEVESGRPNLLATEHPVIAEFIQAFPSGEDWSWAQYQREIVTTNPGYREGTLVAIVVEGSQALHDHLLANGFDDLGAV